MATAAEPRQPESADVVVIGGGIMGAAAAFFLARRGVSVVLCEKGAVGAEQSSRNLGWCRTLGRDPAEMPLMLQSLRFWREGEALLGERTGYRTTGLLYGYHDEKDAAGLGALLDVAAAHGVETRLLRGADAAALLPGAARPPKVAVYAAGDGRAEPGPATQAFARAARSQGVRIFENCAVRTLETSAGRVSGVVTEHGPIRCGAVLLAGGAWSRAFARNAGIDLPQLKAVSSVMSTSPVEGGPDVTATVGSYAFGRRDDGGYTVSGSFSVVADIVPDSFLQFGRFIGPFLAARSKIRLRLGRAFLDEWRRPGRWSGGEASPFEAVRTLDPPPQVADLDASWRDLCDDFPAFRRARITRRWGGAMDATPDMLPIISEVPAVPGLVVSTGYSGHGFGLGPAAGHLAADLVTGAGPIVDPRPFRLDRFRSARRRAAARESRETSTSRHITSINERETA